jgi:hypothetical protein
VRIAVSHPYRRLIVAASLAVCVSWAIPAFAQASRWSLRIRNASNFDIYALYVSGSDYENWGPDQLGSRVLRGGGGLFTLTSIRAGEYDVKFVDEDGDACVLRKVLVTRHLSWELTNTWLLGCEFH